MAEIQRVKVQGHVCPDCGAAVLREVTTVTTEETGPQERTAGYACAAHCGWEIRGPSLPV